MLELKFTDRFPAWMELLVETFNLRRVSVPKYVECVTLLHGDLYEPLQGAGYESDLADDTAFRGIIRPDSDKLAEDL